MSKNNSNYETGYGKPPKHSYFKKGTSGNPKGRPKESKNLDVLLKEELEEKVVIKENGTCKTITKLQAALKQLINKAAQGNLRAIEKVMQHILELEEKQKVTITDGQLNEEDLRVLSTLKKRIEQSLGSTNDGK